MRLRTITLLAVGLLFVLGAQAVAQVRQTPQPQVSDATAKPSAGDIQKLVDQLGSAVFVERKAAANRLAAIGEPAWNALRKAAARSDDLEVRRSASRLARDIGRKTFIEIRHFGAGGGYWLNRVAFTKDGRHALATGGAVIFYDLQSGKELYRTMEVQFARQGLALSQDGRYFLTGHQNERVVRLGEVQTGKEIQTFQGHTAGVHGVALSPDGTWAVTGGDDETLRVWDVKTGKELRQCVGFIGKVRCVTFAPDGRHILSGHYGPKSNTLIYLWDAKTAKLVRSFEGHERDVTALAFFANGRSFLSSSLDGTLRQWDSESGKQLRTMKHDGGTNFAALSPDGRRALSAGFGDKVVRLWDLTDGSELYHFEGHMGAVLGVAFSPDGCQALSSDSENTIRLWRLPKPDAP
jgi:WD40 repeat protein